MKYVVELDGVCVDVDIEGDEVRVGDGAPVRARIEDVPGTPIRLLRIGDRVLRLLATRGRSRGEYSVALGGYRADVLALDERARAIRDLSAASAAASGPAPLVAPMPGLIVRVHVAPGDTVVAGQALVVMEAMKMENELRASTAGTVRRVGVEAGTAVEKGTVLVELADP